MFTKPRKIRFQLSYKKDAVERHQKMERVIMDKMGIWTKSDAIKSSLSNTYKSIHKPDLLFLRWILLNQEDFLWEMNTYKRLYSSRTFIKSSRKYPDLRLNDSGVTWKGMEVYFFLTSKS